MTASDGVEARPIGRLLRFLTGIALVLEGSRHLFGTDPILVGATIAVVLGEFIFYAVLHLVIERFAPSLDPWVGAVLAVTPVLLVFLMSDAPGRLGTLLFVGISLLFTAVRNDGGCEVMTLPGMAFGRRTHLVCIAFSPIDWIEQRAHERRRSS